MIITDHAKERFKDRFPKLNISEEFYFSDPSGSDDIKKKLVRSCPKHAEQWMGNFKGSYLLRRNNVIFIVKPPEVIVTVLDYRELPEI